jgi:hypothetical protein
MRLAKKLLIEHLRGFAAQGLTLAQVAQGTGLAYNYLSTLSSKHEIVFTRQKMAERPQARVRAQDMRQRFENGETLEQIGQRYEVTRERVRQIISKKFGTTGRDGGAAEMARRKRRELHKKRDARAMRVWGCSYRQYLSILRHEDKPTYSYKQQRQNAIQRGIGWELNLWRWWSLWQKSGHWSERGRNRGNYGMCRLNDTGPYSADNVYFATNIENTQDYWVNKRASETALEAIQ